MKGVFGMRVYKVLLLTLHFSLINCADHYKTNFFDCDSGTAAKEIKVIDWALLYAAKKESMNTVAQKIEAEQYSYLCEDDGDHDICCGAMEEIPCPLHVRARLTMQKDSNDYVFLKNLLMISRSVCLKEVSENGHVPGLKIDDSSWEHNFAPSDPPMHLEVLIESVKDANQNRINKNYLLARLRNVCTNDAKM